MVCKSLAPFIPAVVFSSAYLSLRFPPPLQSHSQPFLTVHRIVCKPASVCYRTLTSSGKKFRYRCFDCSRAVPLVCRLRSSRSPLPWFTDYSDCAFHSQLGPHATYSRAHPFRFEHSLLSSLQVLPQSSHLGAAPIADSHSLPHLHTKHSNSACPPLPLSRPTAGPPQNYSTIRPGSHRLVSGTVGSEQKSPRR
ncbi:hypothetical protein BDW02DRAFT_408245 [Decorospora gaudefroyi]|uniref:Uncharacterized protein n=1 Tax=Decorospora gaudefroyi TaxID=184978 RepID=A0A6A5K844_9PLEO|nr:hypothetical protein BDW02DRAFT_408245 [Decorospora gaudefroyi]